MKALTQFPADYRALGGDPAPVLKAFAPVWGWIAEVSSHEPALEPMIAAKSFEKFLEENTETLGDMGIKIEIVSRVIQLSAHGVHMTVDFSQKPWITTVTEPDMGKYSGPPEDPA
ncbi:hypothetical protein F183_A01360 [Bryobacterales bacterium F-183]|nr:hypothetical protein F183_A01360 [Bryobacterales bacterium F-183]